MIRRTDMPLDAADEPSAPTDAIAWLKKALPVLPWLVGFYGLVAWLGAPTALEKDILRTQFHIPPDVPFSEIRVDRKAKTSSPADIQAVVRFSAPQLRHYLAGLDDPAMWKPQPIVRNGRVFDGAYAPDAIAWKEMDVRRQIAWGSLSWKRAQEARNVRLLCFFVRQAGTEVATGAYGGVACSNAPREPGPAMFVQGLIDLDSGTLHMIARPVGVGR